jgi:hypothetical protein
MDFDWHRGVHAVEVQRLFTAHSYANQAQLGSYSTFGDVEGELLRWLRCFSDSGHIVV